MGWGMGKNKKNEVKGAREMGRVMGRLCEDGKWVR